PAASQYLNASSNAPTQCCSFSLQLVGAADGWSDRGHWCGHCWIMAVGDRWPSDLGVDGVMDGEMGFNPSGFSIVEEGATIVVGDGWPGEMGDGARVMGVDHLLMERGHGR
ncbi:hypothetical protein ACLOJK_040557, partial [Asimina triloba]